MRGEGEGRITIVPAGALGELDDDPTDREVPRAGPLQGLAPGLAPVVKADTGTELVVALAVVDLGSAAFGPVRARAGTTCALPGNSVGAIANTAFKVGPVPTHRSRARSPAPDRRRNWRSRRVSAAGADGAGRRVPAGGSDRRNSRRRPRSPAGARASNRPSPVMRSVPAECGLAAPPERCPPPRDGHRGPARLAE